MYKKVLNEDQEGNKFETSNIIPEFKNQGDHASFNKAVRGMTASMNLLRPNAFKKIMVLDCCQEDLEACSASCANLAKEEEKSSSTKSRLPASNHRNVVGILDDIMSYNDEPDYDKVAHDELYKDMAI